MARLMSGDEQVEYEQVKREQERNEKKQGRTAERKEEQLKSK